MFSTLIPSFSLYYQFYPTTPLYSKTLKKDIPIFHSPPILKIYTILLHIKTPYFISFIISFLFYPFFFLFSFLFPFLLLPPYHPQGNPKHPGPAGVCVGWAMSSGAPGRSTCPRHLMRRPLPTNLVTGSRLASRQAQRFAHPTQTPAGPGCFGFPVPMKATRPHKHPKKGPMLPKSMSPIYVLNKINLQYV